MSDSTKPRPRRPGWFYRVMMAFLGMFDRWLHLSCRSFVRLASDKYERPLSLGERQRQAVHRMICSICRIQESRMDQLQTLVHDVARNSPEDGQAELSTESLQRMRKAMLEAAQKEPNGDSEP